MQTRHHAARPVRRRSAVLVLAAGLVALAGCSDDETPSGTGLTEIGGPADVASSAAAGAAGTDPGADPGAGGGGDASSSSSASGTGTAAGSGSGSGAGTVVSGGPTTAVTGTVAATAAPTTALATTTSPAPTTTAAPAVETLPPTTAGPATPPCDLALVVAQTETGFDGIEPRDLRCSGTWAAWVGAAIDPSSTDSFFAVASWDGTAWVLVNLGTAGVCGDGGVPPSLWASLGCTE